MLSLLGTSAIDRSATWPSAKVEVESGARLDRVGAAPVGQQGGDAAVGGVVEETAALSANWPFEYSVTLVET